MASTVGAAWQVHAAGIFGVPALDVPASAWSVARVRGLLIWVVRGSALKPAFEAGPLRRRAARTRAEVLVPVSPWIGVACMARRSSLPAPATAGMAAVPAMPAGMHQQHPAEGGNVEHGREWDDAGNNQTDGHQPGAQGRQQPAWSGEG